jgi:hypothetical protein
LLVLENSPPSAWRETGVRTRPNLHGLLRYPAMMVPCMQGDIIDVILAHRPGHCRVLDPFVGSGTVMTEALVRGLNFTGVGNRGKFPGWRGGGWGNSIWSDCATNCFPPGGVTGSKV